MILENGILKFQEGTSLNLPASITGTLSSGDRMVFNDAGEASYLLRINVTGGGTQGVLIWNDLLLMASGVTPCTAPGAPAGAIWAGIDEMWVNTNRQALVIGRLDNNETLVAVIEFDAAANITSQTILAIRGQTLTAPGHNAPIQGFSAARRRQAINASGQTVWVVDDQNTTPAGVSNTCCDSWFYMDNMPILHEGDPIAGGPSVVGTLSSAEIDINDAGDWVVQCARNSGFNEDVILLNGTTILAEEGGTLAGIPGFTIQNLANTAGVFLGNDGRVVFYVDWDDPNLDVDTGIFINQDLFLQEGVSMVNGVIIDVIEASENTIEVSDEGNLLIVELVLVDGTSGAYLYDLGGRVGTNFCSALPNDTGVPGRISATGSNVATDNDLTLLAENLPANQFGIFVTSRTQDFQAGGTFSNGNVCLGTPIGRFNLPGQILSTGTNGSFSLNVNLSQFPQGAQIVQVMAGETWNFQAWHREFSGLQSNFTDGYQIDFQ